MSQENKLDWTLVRACEILNAGRKSFFWDPVRDKSSPTVGSMAAYVKEHEKAPAAPQSRHQMQENEMREIAAKWSIMTCGNDYVAGHRLARQYRSGGKAGDSVLGLIQFTISQTRKNRAAEAERG